MKKLLLLLAFTTIVSCTKDTEGVFENNLNEETVVFTPPKASTSSKIAGVQYYQELEVTSNEDAATYTTQILSNISTADDYTQSNLEIVFIRENRDVIWYIKNADTAIPYWRSDGHTSVDISIEWTDETAAMNALYSAYHSFIALSQIVPSTDRWAFRVVENNHIWTIYMNDNWVVPVEEVPETIEVYYPVYFRVLDVTSSNYTTFYVYGETEDGEEWQEKLGHVSVSKGTHEFSAKYTTSYIECIIQEHTGHITKIAVRTRLHGGDHKYHHFTYTGDYVNLINYNSTLFSYSVSTSAVPLSRYTGTWTENINGNTDCL